MTVKINGWNDLDSLLEQMKEKPRKFRPVLEKVLVEQYGFKQEYSYFSRANQDKLEYVFLHDLVNERGTYLFRFDNTDELKKEFEYDVKNMMHNSNTIPFSLQNILTSSIFGVFVGIGTYLIFKEPMASVTLSAIGAIGFQTINTIDAMNSNPQYFESYHNMFENANISVKTSEAKYDRSLIGELMGFNQSAI